MTEQTLESLLDTSWQHLIRGVVDHHHPARHPALATIGPDGPELRTLVLRHANRAGAVLELHTDAASPKVSHIAADPRVALHVWLPKSRLQIRMRAHATLEPGDPALFAALPPEARANYDGPVPGASLSGQPGIATGDPNRFARILCHLTEIDALLLTNPHRRARYRADAIWQGQWIAP